METKLDQIYKKLTNIEIQLTKLEAIISNIEYIKNNIKQPENVDINGLCTKVSKIHISLKIRKPVSRFRVWTEKEFKKPTKYIMKFPRNTR